MIYFILEPRRLALSVAFSRSLALLALIAAVATISGCASMPPASDRQPSLVLVSIDGFRWDFRSRGETPNLDRLAATGISAHKLVPVFPSKTFPNHYSIATGLYAENHGLVANNIYDPEFNANYSLGRRDEVAKGRWYGGEPIWVTAQSHGLRTAPVFWPGSEAEIKGRRPTYWQPYDGEVADSDRVDKLLALLDLPDGERPAFLTLYFDIIDHVAHRTGPGPSARLQEAVEHVDAMVGRLLDGLAARRLTGQVDVLVTSDHGMSQNSRDRVIFLDTFIDIDRARPVDWDPILGLWPADNQVDAVYRQLAGAHPHLAIYKRQDVPPRLHYSRHHRIPPIIGIADDGWAISTSERFEHCQQCFTGGNHGFDPALDSMGALLVGAGPSLASGVHLEEVAAVDLYNLMCSILGIDPAPNDGDFEAVTPFLIRDRQSRRE